MWPYFRVCKFSHIPRPKDTGPCLTQSIYGDTPALVSAHGDADPPHLIHEASSDHTLQLLIALCPGRPSICPASVYSLSHPSSTCPCVCLNVCMFSHLSFHPPVICTSMLPAPGTVFSPWGQGNGPRLSSLFLSEISQVKVKKVLVRVKSEVPLQFSPGCDTGSAPFLVLLFPLVSETTHSSPPWLPVLSSPCPLGPRPPPWVLLCHLAVLWTPTLPVW